MLKFGTGSRGSYTRLRAALRAGFTPLAIQVQQPPTLRKNTHILTPGFPRKRAITASHNCSHSRSPPPHPPTPHPRTHPHHHHTHTATTTTTHTPPHPAVPGPAFPPRNTNRCNTVQQYSGAVLHGMQLHPAHHAVGDHKVDRRIGDACRRQILDLSLQKPHVAAAVAQRLGRAGGPREGRVVVRHVGWAGRGVSEGRGLYRALPSVNYGRCCTFAASWRRGTEQRGQVGQRGRAQAGGGAHLGAVVVGVLACQFQLQCVAAGAGHIKIFSSWPVKQQTTATNAKGDTRPTPNCTSAVFPVPPPGRQAPPTVPAHPSCRGQRRCRPRPPAPRTRSCPSRCRSPGPAPCTKSINQSTR